MKFSTESKGTALRRCLALTTIASMYMAPVSFAQSLETFDTESAFFANANIVSTEGFDSYPETSVQEWKVVFDGVEYEISPGESAECFEVPGETCWSIRAHAGGVSPVSTPNSLSSNVLGRIGRNDDGWDIISFGENQGVDAFGFYFLSSLSYEDVGDNNFGWQVSVHECDGTSTHLDLPPETAMAARYLGVTSPALICRLEVGAKGPPTNIGWQAGNWRYDSVSRSSIVSIDSNAGETYEGVNFPDGPISFVDQVVNYEPLFGGGPPPALASQDAIESLGVPMAGGVSLGNGGRITLQFVDNRLTGSGDGNPDLWIFQAGGAETVHVEISKNGRNWTDAGAVSALVSGVDIDSFGFDSDDRIRFVRLTDDGDSPTGSPFVQGADIVAVGASSSVAAENARRKQYWIQAHVGGRSRLIIQANTLQWHHLEGTAPGRGTGFWSFDTESNSPTIIDSNQGPNIGWIPEGWPDYLGNGAHPESYSSIFEHLTPVFPARDIRWRLKKLAGLGNVRIVEQPTTSNGHMLIIEFDDLGKGANPNLAGTGFYKVQLIPRNWP